MDIVTGGLGYIGNNLEPYLTDPLIYDLKNGNDVLDFPNLFDKMRGKKTCYHLAAISNISECEKNPLQAIENNISGTSNILRASKKLGVKVVFASSFAIYDNPHTVYGMTKALGEKLVKQHGGVICRIANVYGGKNFLEKETAVSKLMKGTFEERGHGQEKRDFIHINEVCSKLVGASGLPPKSVVDICTGKTLSIDEVITLSNRPGFPMSIRSSARSTNSLEI